MEALVTGIAGLRRAVRDEPVHGDGGWDQGLDVDGFLRWVTADLNRLSLVVVEHAEFGHYGSGYASYAEVFTTKRDGSVRREVNGGVGVECLNVLLCRLAPVACLLSPADRWNGPGRTGSWALPHVDRVIGAPDRSWTGEHRQIKGVLDRHGIALAGPASLTRPLPAGLTAETDLADSAQTIFDAWFHWCD